jgi:asparagine synthase (glutamine-hydrolysing)
MCGLVGYISLHPQTDQEKLLLARRMAEAIRTRGPDDAGEWSDAPAFIALGHRRLSIVDLSAAGHQPMHSASGRWVIVFNGEIYNHLELRADLGEVAWRGHSDTETLLAGFERWGIRGTVERAVGMFAFAVWDRQERQLILVRDRFGEKPLYYGWQGDSFLFASELKALRLHPSWRGELERRAVSLYVRHNCIPAPWSIFRDVYKLLPGTILTLPVGERLSRGSLPNPEPYWSLSDVAVDGSARRWSGTDAEAVDELERVLRRAVGAQMVADVPLGAFLSGGIDSSVVVALMQAQSAQRVRTFSIGFESEDYNEATHAKAVAEHLGTLHTEHYVTAAESLAVIPRLPEIYDEPFADSSQIPTFLVSQLARRHVTVSLSGDAGDELFGGYNRYFLAARLWRGIARVPRSLRSGVASAIKAIPPSRWNSLYALASPLLPSALRLRLPGDKLHKAAGVLAASDQSALYRMLVTHWEPESVVLGASEPETAPQREWNGIESLAAQMMAWDAVSYLPDDILTKVDRAAMAVSLETRVPMLDHRVAELAWRLPDHMKIRGGVGKWVLRQVLYRHVPQSLIDRPKMGFGVPIDVWLRGPLRPWAESLLDSARIRGEGNFVVEPIHRMWTEHVSGRRNWQHHLWDILMFQAWLERSHG